MAATSPPASGRFGDGRQPQNDVGAVCCAGSRVGARSEARTARYLDAIRTSPMKLRAFLKAMPKGADLHNHLSGAVPTETLIGYAVADGLCIDTTTLTATPAPVVTGGSCPAGQRPAADSTADAAFFAQLVRAWSMEGFQPGAESGHDHFFCDVRQVRIGDQP